MSSCVVKCLSYSSSFLRANFSANKVYVSPFMTSAYVNSTTKHWNPKFKKERAAKYLKINLPNFDDERKDKKLTTEEMRAKMKEKGVVPTRQWHEKPMFVDASGGIFEPYVPPEGDGKISTVSPTNLVTDMYDRFGKKSKSYLSLRKIRKIDYEFDVPTVAEKAKVIYIEAQKALAAKDEDKLHELATEKAFPELMENVKNKTIVWNLIQFLETPRIVQIRAQDLMDRNNMFAQVTVRLYTQQTLAVYDRFGRLMHGSESTVKDVLEYVVFEKHITNPNSNWRIHGKIIPDWSAPRDPIAKTFHRPDIDKEFPEPPKDDPPKETAKEEQTSQPALATA